MTTEALVAKIDALLVNERRDIALGREAARNIARLADKADNLKDFLSLVRERHALRPLSED